MRYTPPYTPSQLVKKTKQQDSIDGGGTGIDKQSK